MRYLLAGGCGELAVGGGLPAVEQYAGAAAGDRDQTQSEYKSLKFNSKITLDKSFRDICSHCVGTRSENLLSL